MASKHFRKLGKPAIDARLHHNTDKQGVVVSLDLLLQGRVFRLQNMFPVDCFERLLCPKCDAHADHYNANFANKLAPTVQRL